MPTKQQTFNTVVKALFKQNCRSASSPPDDANSRCFYRGPNESKCAAGHLIPDEKYQSKMEGISINKYNIVGKVLQEQGHDLHLCFALQSVHDKYEVEYWKEQFAEVAQRFHLEFDSSLKLGE